MSQTASGTVIIIAGYNGLAAARAWAGALAAHQRHHRTIVCSWRKPQDARAALAAAPAGAVTLIGHSLGGGHAQRLALQSPQGRIGTLITVAPFAPPELDTAQVREQVGFWLNIVAAPRWHDHALDRLARCLLGWRDQGVIRDASENRTSESPHQDFYRLMSEGCGRAEHGEFDPRGRALT